MVAHRDFDARPRSDAPIAGSFDLGGVTWRIRARTEVPYALVEQMLGGGDDDQPQQLTVEEFQKLAPEEQVKRAQEMRQRGRRMLVQTDEFFAATIVADQVEDFLKLVHDPTGPYTVEVSQEIPGYIISCLFGGGDGAGPTVPSRPSRSGRRATGSTSKGGSSSRAKRKVRSAT